MWSGVRPTWDCQLLRRPLARCPELFSYTHDSAISWVGGYLEDRLDRMQGFLQTLRISDWIEAIDASSLSGVSHVLSLPRPARRNSAKRAYHLTKITKDCSLLLFKPRTWICFLSHSAIYSADMYFTRLLVLASSVAVLANALAIDTPDVLEKVSSACPHLVLSS